MEKYRVIIKGGHVEFVKKTDADLFSSDIPGALDVVKISETLSPAASVFIQTPLEFIERLTDAEKVGIFTSSDAGVVVFRSMAMAAQEIRSDDERTLDGLGYLVALGVLTSERAAALISPAA
jgi:hypothetical protein